MPNHPSRPSTGTLLSFFLFFPLCILWYTPKGLERLLVPFPTALTSVALDTGLVVERESFIV